MSLPADPSASQPVAVTSHPPERRRGGRPVVLPAGCCCCCCCCCCLHTIGGIVGGVVGSVNPIEPMPRRMGDPDAPFPFRRDEFESEGPLLPASVLYWLITSALLFLATGVYALTTTGANPLADQLLIGAFLVVMCFPALQLGASVLSVLAVLIFYPEKGMALQRIGQITLWSFVGALAGLLVMGAGLAVLVVTLK